jgi:type I restriction enzyme S subunit
MSWEKIEIGEICDVISGYAFKSKDFTKEKNIPVVKIKNIKNGYTEVSDEYFVKSEFLTKINSKFHLKKGDILISLTGSHITLPNSAVGRIAKYQYDFISFLNQRAGKIIPKDDKQVFQAFLFYFLSTYEVRFKLAQFGRGGANQCNISPSNVKSVLIDLPPLPTQKKIASILSAYDDLIENNLKRIQLLEETAQRIYKEWFVNFKFPNHENTFINKETGLPERWEICKIKDFGEVVTGKTPSTKKKEFYNGKIPFVKTPDMHDGNYILNTGQTLTEEGSKIQLKKLLPINSILVSCIGTAGTVGIISEPSQFNQQINAVKFSVENKYIYFYYFAKSLKVQLEALGSNGATMVNVNKGKFEKIDILNPSPEILKIFHIKTEKLLNQILILKKQNQSLKEARDLLLPRLMNRTLEV